MAFLYGHLSQGGKYLSELYVLRTLGIAAITLDASPKNGISEDFLTQAEQDLANNFARIKLRVNLANRASGGAGAAGKTSFDVFSARTRSYFKLEIRVKIFGL